MEEQFVSIGKMAKMLGMIIDGLQKWEREWRLTPVCTVTNHRRYRMADLKALMHETEQHFAHDTRCILDAESPRKNSKRPGIWTANSGGSSHSLRSSVGLWRLL
jgi:hypothetical protein